MVRHLTILLAAFLLVLAFSPAPRLTPASSAAGREQKVFGWLVRRGNVLVLQTDNEDYIVAGKNLIGLEGKLVEITGVVTRSDQGDTINVASARELDE